MQGDGEGYGGGGEQRHDVDQGVGRHLAGEQRADQRDALGLRKMHRKDRL